MTATVAGIHLGIDTHANRPAGNAVPDGSIYSCSTHSLVYKSNFAGNSWATWATLGTAFTPGAAVSAVQAGPYTTTSGSVVDMDATNLALTLTTGARRCLVGVTCVYKVSDDTTSNGYLALKIDSGAYSGAIIYGSCPVLAGPVYPMSFVYPTGVLSAASHTFKLGFAVDTSRTFSVSNVQMWVIEQNVSA